jgi:phosphohistidine swiveling domain-containing protein
MSHLDYYSIVNYRESCEDDEIRWIWKSLIKSRKEEKQINQLLSLPPLVFSEKDFIAVPSYSAAPNYITDASVEGTIVFLDEEDSEIDISDKIVVIEKADPGYDWIFTKRILGLITKYGGAASHMAIRCSEFGIPAAIGCGDMLFSRITKSSRVILDCGKRTVSTF